MCGIVGVLTSQNNPVVKELAPLVKAMSDTLMHRGPDVGDAWVDMQAGIALGHRRLSILDLSPEGKQPMISACGRYVIVFNGEIYNYREIRTQIEKDFGFTQWRGHSDTEVMLAAIAHWGVEKSLKKFNGMFAFGLWDRQEKYFYLARDRFGEKPLYYGRLGQSFVFASELRPFKKNPEFNQEINREALVLFLRYGYIPAPFSIYKDIYKLPPANFLKFPHDSLFGSINSPVAISEYWSIQSVAQEGHKNPLRITEVEMIEELERLLTDAVKIRLESDVPLGAFLSGGIDSSTIVAFMQKLNSRPIKTFSIGFHEEEFNEAQHAKEVAKYLGTEHHEQYLTAEDSLKIIPKLPSMYDEPFADPSQIPTYLVSRFARDQVTVCLSGDAGDECFGGYKRYFLGKMLQEKTGWVPKGLKSFGSQMVQKVSPQVWDRLLTPLGYFLPDEFGKKSYGDKIHKLADIMGGADSYSFYQSLISHWRNTQGLVLGASEPSLDSLKGIFSHNGFSAAEGMMLTDLMMYLPDDILVKVDRASMAVSLEARVPLLDPRIVEFAWKIPEKYKILDNKGKLILRKLLYRHVPKVLIERPKMGFGVPIGEWLRGPIKSWAEDLLEPKKLTRDSFFNVERVREAWVQHQSGHRNLQYQLWNVLMFQAWLSAE